MACNIDNFNVLINSFSYKKNSIEKGKSYNIDTNLARKTGTIQSQAPNPKCQSVFVNLTLDIVSSKEKPAPFDLQADVTGVFEISKDSTKEEIELFLENNATRIVFPYLRSLVASITSNAMIPTLNLPLIFVDEPANLPKSK